MPTYDYKCPGCSHETQIEHKMSDINPHECPSCNKFTLIKGLGGGLGFQFKGSGFYETDYKKK